MKADPRDQQRLLDLQAIDTRAAQLDRARSKLPVLARLEELARTRMLANDDVVSAQTEHGDLEREVTKAEADVQLVRDRAARDQAHLDSGRGTAKELTTGSILLTSYYSQIIDPLLSYKILNTIVFILVFFLLINQISSR